jgi:hypothetical protein
MSFNKKALNVEAEMKIAQNLESLEGRTVLAQAMVEPIRRALEYQAIGRKLLMIDELPQGALARYEKDVRARAYRISKRGGVPDEIIEGEEILVPTFELATYPQVRISEVKARRFFIVDRAQIKAKEALQKEEDSNIIRAIEAAVTQENTVVSSGGTLSMYALNQAFAAVELNDLTVAKILCHALRYADIRVWGQTVFDQATLKDVLTTGLFGHLWTADIHVSSRVPRTTVYVLAPAEYVGAFPIRQDITVIPADDPRNLRLGWVVYEEIGIIIVNNYAIAKVTITGS